jgi:hypothetical protein
MVELDYGPYGRPGDRGAGASDMMPDAHHTDAVVRRLRETRPWVLVLAVLGFLGGGFLLLAAVLVVVGLAAAAGSVEGAQIAAVVFGGAFYGLLGAFCLFYAALLLRYFRAIGSFLVTETTAELEGAVDAQRVFWKATGIATIASVALAILLTIGMLVFSVAAASGAF